MSKRNLAYTVVGWCILTIIEYYFLPYFIVTLLWLVLSLGLLVIAIIQLVKLIKERKRLTRLRILNVIIFSLLLYFTCQPWIVSGLIEKVDWKIFFNKRTEVVEQVKRNELSSNESAICKLPFEIPVLSNGGNEIEIYRNQTNETVTVSFWIYRNFFSSPSPSFVYTNDNEEIKEFEKIIADNPDHNWKIQDNWYRLFGD